MAQMKRKAAWMRRLARAKNFILIADGDSVINIRGTDPRDLKDAIEIGLQRTTLVMFRDKLDALIKEHETILNGKPVRRIKVKKG